MSSARKRAAIQKANNEADLQRQRAMRAEHQVDKVTAFAQEATMRYQELLLDVERTVETEREACAAVCELLDTGSYPINLGDEAADKAKSDCAALIRARSNLPTSGLPSIVTKSAGCK